MINDSLEKLRELTHKLPPVPSLGNFKQEQDRCTEYIMEVGTCISYALLSRPEASAALTFISSGGKFPEHNHDQTEYVIVISGSMIVYTGDKRETLMAGGFVTFAPGSPHRVRALEDVWLIAITVPQSNDFPQTKSIK